MKFLITILILLSQILISANSNLPNNPHVFVTGNAELSARPDIAVLYLRVESLKPTSLQAKNDVDERVNNLLDGLERFDINENNISASNITTEPRHQYVKQEQKLIGYFAERTLKVTLLNIEKLNSFMDFVLEVKINSINNVEFKSSKETELKDKVNALAVKDAKEKGTSLAEAFGATLGTIYSINSSNNSSRYRYGANSAVEKIVVTGSRIDNRPSRPGKYLQENIVFSSSINAVFNIDVN